MEHTVAMWAHRTLKHLHRYHQLTAADAVSFDIAPREHEHWIGWYENYLATWRDGVLLSDRGIYVSTSDEWRIIDYADIQQIDTPDTKVQVRGLKLRLRSGTSVWLPILGGDEKFSDAFAFLQFFDRVMAYYKE